MRNISVFFFKIWTSGSDVILSYFLSRALVALFIQKRETINLFNFGIFVIIFDLDQWFRRRSRLKVHVI